MDSDQTIQAKTLLTAKYFPSASQGIEYTAFDAVIRNRVPAAAELPEDKSQA